MLDDRAEAGGTQMEEENAPRLQVVESGSLSETQLVRGIQEYEATDDKVNENTGKLDTARLAFWTDDASNNIPLFWAWQREHSGKSAVISFLVAAGWFGFGYLHQHDTPRKWSYLLGFFMFSITVLSLPFVYQFTMQVLTAPFFLVHCFYVCLVTPFLVITTHRFQGERLHNCKLCQACHALFKHSPLLVGSPWFVARSYEEHSFYKSDELRASALTCHLCSLFLHSFEDNTKLQHIPAFQHLQSAYINTPAGDSKGGPSSTARTLAAEETSVNSTSRQSISKIKEDSNRTSLATQLTVRVWVESFYFQKPIMRTRIHGNSILSGALEVQLLAASKDGPQHRCFHTQRTDSQDIIEWSNGMIRECSKQHELCRSQFVARESKNYLPTRLLNVRGTQNGTIRLVTTAELPRQPIEYFALSHCWGGSVDVKLRKGNVDDMKIINLESLPATFQDAVSISWRLGVHYLWIDSLCIVQDDEREWEVESTNMGMVYANAKCVISATASQDSTGGCFKSRDLFFNDCVLHQKGNRQLVVRTQYQPDLTNLFQARVESAPLTKRGWTFQERYLASRILHYSSGVVFFECNKLIASEHDQGQVGREYSARQIIRSDGTLHSTGDCNHAEKYISETTQTTERQQVEGQYDEKGHPKWEDVVVERHNPAYTVQQNLIKELIRGSARLGLRGTFDFLWRFCGTDLREAVEFHISWFEMVEHYSSRSLTRKDDRLMAISGIAYFIQGKTHLTYNSGLWNEVLPFNLLWTVSGKLHDRPKRSVPTWSWASVDGRISHRLREVAAPAPKQFRSSWADIVCRIPRSIQMKTIDVVNGMILNSTLELTCTLCEFQQGTVNVLWDSPVTDKGELLLLPILSFYNPRVHPVGNRTQLHGIVLREKAPDIFERVAYFWTHESMVNRLERRVNQIYRNRTFQLM